MIGGGPGPRVLMYHGVGHVARERDPHGMFVTAAAFRGQVEWLLEHDFRPLSETGFLGALDGQPVPRRSVVITFDDGYLGVGEYAAPILRDLGVPSILFVPSRLIGGMTDWLAPADRHPLMSADELRTLGSAGMAVGAHGLDHRDLSGMDAGGLTQHTAEARRELEAALGAQVRTFAYPFGCHDAAARRAVRDAGYAAAFAVHDGAGRFAVTRTDVNATDTPRTFRVKLLPVYPAARRVSSRAPAVRRLAHVVLGRQQ